MGLIVLFVVRVFFVDLSSSDLFILRPSPSLVPKKIRAKSIDREYLFNHSKPLSMTAFGFYWRSNQSQRLLA